MKPSIIIFFIFLSFELVAQSNVKIYKIYTYGNDGGRGDSCMRAVNEKYGFKIIPGGCNPVYRKIRQGRRKLAKLDKRNGEGWREKYKKEFKSCKKEYELVAWFDRDFYIK